MRRPSALSCGPTSSRWATGFSPHPPAEEALAAVREHGPPDVAVLDVSLPDIRGFELAQKLRAEIGCEQVPIIFLSANVDQEHIDRGRELGATYLTKPYIRSALGNAIDKAVPTPDGW
jgi:CheY-like chemotaxis protein